MKHVVVVGAGFGGLTAAAELARNGIPVTVLETHIYPGGCAGTFYHQGYRFDAGATLAGGFANGAPMDRLGKRLGIDWQCRVDRLPMQVHLPGNIVVNRWSNMEEWKRERGHVFGVQAEKFWGWQEHTADHVWALASRMPEWPPQNLKELGYLTRSGFGWLNSLPNNGLTILPGFLADVFRPAVTHLADMGDRLRLFVDAQLLISSQTTSQRANAVYASVALDLPRQGVVHIPGGMGGMAKKLVEAVEKFGGKVLYRQEVTEVQTTDHGHFQLTTKRDTIDAEIVIFNLSPWNITKLINNNLPPKLVSLGSLPRDCWGAFMVYVGLDDDSHLDQNTLHHQVIVAEPLGEGNSIFLSLSPKWDENRAPAGQRALTISTHTRLDKWWQLYEQDREAYENRKTTYTERILDAAVVALPGIREAARLVMPGTPVTFQRFTHRESGWVGGFPQTNLFRVWGPRLSKNIWIVGDSIFPGQSVPAVTMGGLRVANAILREM
jgi:C-3',4' desaturase CrtD